MTFLEKNPRFDNTLNNEILDAADKYYYPLPERVKDFTHL